MSKMDDMRAMREARFGQAAPRAAAPAVAPKKAQPSRPKAAPAPSGASGSDSPEARLCGHRAISGRTCTREHGHEARSHRYS
jgi:hypothetical protein